MENKKKYIYKKNKKYYADNDLAGELFQTKQNEDNTKLKKNYKKIYKLKKQKKINAIKEKYPQLNPSAIGQIIAGQTTLGKELIKAKIKSKKEKRKKRIEKKIQALINKYPDMLKKTANKIARGVISIDDYIISRKKKKYRNPAN